MSLINLEDNTLQLCLGDIVQQFTEEDLQKTMPVFMQDIDAETKPVIETYQNYISTGDFENAEIYRNEHPELQTRIWDAYKANSFMAYAAYVYLYAKSQRQQCVISSTQPTESSEDETIGQSEGDIWFKLESIENGVMKTTPYQKQADGTYKEFAVAPKLEYASENDVLTIATTSESSLSDPEKLINLERLKEYDTKFIKTLRDKIQSFENTKSQLVSSALGRVLGLTSSSTWNNVISKIVGVKNRGSLDYSDSNSVSVMQAGYYTGGTIDTTVSYENGYNNGYVACQEVMFSSNQSGSFDVWVTTNVTEIFNFPKRFPDIPNVTITNTDAGDVSVTIEEVAPTYFSYNVVNKVGGAHSITVSWSAYV